MPNFLKEIILPFLPSALTIIGWWIVGSRDNKSKKNAIHNKRVEAAINLINKILLDAKKFYSLSGTDQEAQGIRSIITSDFKKLSALVILISENFELPQKTSLSMSFIDFKKIVTGGSFETLERNITSNSNQLYIDIDSLHNELFVELEKSYKI